jgi:hypothetical protein
MKTVPEPILQLIAEIDASMMSKIQSLESVKNGRVRG